MSNVVTTALDTAIVHLKDTIDVALTKDVDVSLKDTSLVSIVDTVTLYDPVPWWLNPAWYSLLTAALAIFISIWIAIYTRRSETRSIRKEISSGWLGLTEHRMEFWESIPPAYERWRTSYIRANPKSDPPPEDIESLISVASLPPEIARIKDTVPCARSIRSVLSEPNQLLIWEFAVTVYPESKSGRSAIKVGVANAESENAKFDRIRNELTLALDGWAEITTLKYLTERFRGDHLLVAMLAWLELALIAPLRGKWSYRAGFFLLVQKLLH
ncbi:MAG: hypothetical protein J7J98_04330 [candidate division Zixibacteria bacterium]|nr:hypothetical protein [candidate division Zixibacteria bacterium]